MLRRHTREVPSAPCRGARSVGLAALLLLAAAPAARAQGPSDPFEQDRLDITGRQNLTLGSGARAYGMGGAFLARADDATAASWNPAGLSYLRQPELSLVGVYNSFGVTRNIDTDTFQGQAIDFAAFTWPIGIRGGRGAVQLSYQRGISFDGHREIKEYDSKGLPRRTDDGVMNGGFDVIAFGTGLRLSRHLRAGFTVNRWLNGYTQNLTRQVYSVVDPVSGAVIGPPHNPVRKFGLDFRPDGWSANFGLMVSPVESLNIGAVYKTGFGATVELDKTRVDGWGTLGQIGELTYNSHSSSAVAMEFPASFGLGLSWRPRDTLTLSADFTITRWSQATIQNYFTLDATPPAEDAVTPPPPTPPTILGLRQYPTLQETGQQDKQELRIGVEWVLIKGAIKVPLRAGYFSDRQIIPDLSGDVPRFNGFTAGIGVVLGPVLLDAAWVYEFGSSYNAIATGDLDPANPTPPTTALQRYAATTNRGFASVIYRFNRGH